LRNSKQDNLPKEEGFEENGFHKKKPHEGKHKEETVRKFYEQKGTAIPEEESKWIRKGKEYKKPKTTKANVKEADGGYGDLLISNTFAL
jgi:hypothetical protein